MRLLPANLVLLLYIKNKPLARNKLPGKQHRLSDALHRTVFTPVLLIKKVQHPLVLDFCVKQLIC